MPSHALACPRTHASSSPVLPRPPAPLSIDYIMKHHYDEMRDEKTLCLGHNRLVASHEYGEFYDIRGKYMPPAQQPRTMVYLTL